MFPARSLPCARAVPDADIVPGMDGRPRESTGKDTMKGSWLGPEFTDAEIVSYLDSVGAVSEKLSDSDLCDRVAHLMADEKVLGWFRGRMEFGPRALGARSIISP